MTQLDHLFRRTLTIDPLLAGLFWIAFAVCLYVVVPLGLLYALVQFVKWAW